MNINVLEKELALLLVSKQEEKAMEDNFTNLKSFVRGLFAEYRGEN